MNKNNKRLRLNEKKEIGRPEDDKKKMNKRRRKKSTAQIRTRPNPKEIHLCSR